MIGAALGWLKRNPGPALAGIALFGGFSIALFFSGFDKPYFAPALLLTLIASAAALLPGIRKGWSFPASGTAIMLLLFWLWLEISTTWSTVVYDSILFLIIIGSMPLLFFSFTQSQKADALIGATRATLLVSNTLLAGWALFQFFFLNDLVGDRVHHPMLNPNNLGVTLMMAFFLALPLYVRADGKGRLVFGAIISILFFALMTTQSRGGTLGLLLGLVAFLFICRRILTAHWKKLAAVLAIIIGEAFAYYLLRDQHVAALHLFGGGDATWSNEVRTYLWHSGYEMLKAHPWIGPGLGTFYLTFPPYREALDISDGFFLHVDPIQFWIETGLPAAVFFYGFVAAVFFRTVRLCRQPTEENHALIEVAAGFGGLLSLLINAHLDYDLYMLTAEIQAGILLTAWYRNSEEILEDSPRFNLSLRNRAHRIFMAPVFAVIFLMLPVWIAKAGMGVYYDSKVVASIQAGDMQSAARYGRKLLASSPSTYDRAYSINALWRTRLLQTQFYNLDPDQRESLFNEAKLDYERSLRLNPYNSFTLNQYSLLYYIAYPRLDPDGLDHARAILEKAKVYDPVNLDLRMGLSKILELQGQPYPALDVLQEGLKYRLTHDGASPQYLMMIADLQEKLGQHDQALETVKAAQKRQDVLQTVMQNRFKLQDWIDRNLGGLLDR